MLQNSVRIWKLATILRYLPTYLPTYATYKYILYSIPAESLQSDHSPWYTSFLRVPSFRHLFTDESPTQTSYSVSTIFLSFSSPTKFFYYLVRSADYADHPRIGLYSLTTLAVTSSLYNFQHVNEKLESRPCGPCIVFLRYLRRVGTSLIYRDVYAQSCSSTKTKKKS